MAARKPLGEPLCAECFPPSWKDLPKQYDSVGCAHGTYRRFRDDEETAEDTGTADSAAAQVDTEA